MGSRKTSTPSLRLHGPKQPVQQHPDPITDSLLDLVASLPPPSQLPNTLDSMPPPDLPAAKRRSIAPGTAIFSQMLASKSLSLLQRSESSCSCPSCPSFAVRIQAVKATQLDSQYDSQLTYDDKEDREESEREVEALKKAQSQQSDQQKKKDKEPVRAKPPKPPLTTLQQDPVEIDSSEEDEDHEIVPYKLNMECFWEGEKIAFNTEIEKRQLGDNHPSLYLLSAAQDSKAREHATLLGHVACHQVSLVATP